MHAAIVNEISAVSKNLYIICMSLPEKFLLMTSIQNRDMFQHLTGDLQPKNIQAAIFDIHGCILSDLRLNIEY